jgi:hypothetical protein
VIKDETAESLSAALKEAKEDLFNYKEGIESKEEAEALERVAHRDYFDENEVLNASTRSISENHVFGSSAGSGGGLFGGLFNRSKTNLDGDGDHVDWRARALEKDKRISELELAVADNAMTMANLKNELMMASSKFKEDESQRRLLIQRLENENQAFLIKIEILQNEFEEIRKRKEAAAITHGSFNVRDDDGSVGSSIGSNPFSVSSRTIGSNDTSGLGSNDMTGVTSVTGKSRLTPLERDNKKLKKQKKVYENRIASLQLQLSEIQQIVPELMSKSKAQIQKLESIAETQCRESEVRERSLIDEIAQLRQQNEQLQAATRSRLQESDVGRQEEIDQLKMRLEVREATIKKLEMMSSSGKFSRMRGVPMPKRKKKKKTAINGDDDNDGEISVISSSFSVATDSAFSAM